MWSTLLSLLVGSARKTASDGLMTHFAEKAKRRKEAGLERFHLKEELRAH